MRADIRFNLTCSICCEVLEAETNKGKSGIKCDNSENATMYMAIKPCEKCYRKARRPGELIKQAIEEARAGGSAT